MESLAVIVKLISSTTTNTGLHIECGVDETEYRSGIKVSDEEMAQINIEKNEFHGEWNYTIFPH